MKEKLIKKFDIYNVMKSLTLFTVVILLVGYLFQNIYITYIGMLLVLLQAVFVTFYTPKSEKDIVLFAKARESAIIPSKRDSDAGYDIYASFTEDYIEIKPHQTVMIPSGIKSAFDSKYVAILKERGSTGTKGLGQRAGVIDSNFRAEWQIPITNHNKVPVYIIKENAAKYSTIKEKEDTKKAIIYPYEKAISQVVFLPLADLIVSETLSETVDSIESVRGAGMLGSSGK